MKRVLRHFLSFSLALLPALALAQIQEVKTVKGLDSPTIQVVKATGEVWLAQSQYERLLNGVLPLDSMGKLRRLTTVSATAIYRVTEKYRAGDFKWDSTSLAADDDGMVLVTLGGKRLIRQRGDNTVSPEIYGAHPDYGNDATAAINKALAYAASVKAVTTALGRYRISGRLMVFAGRTLVGGGFKTDYSGLKVDTTYKGHVIELQNETTVQNLALYCADNTRDNDTTQVGFFVPESAQHVTLKDVNVNGTSVGYELKAFYHVLSNVNGFNLNIGMLLKGREDYSFAYTGSLKVFGAWFAHCTLSAVKAEGWIGESDIYGFTGEYNRYHIHNAGSNLKIYPTYLGDDPRYAIYNQSGETYVDGGAIASLNSSGELWVQGGESPRAAYMGGGVWCAAGKVTLANLRLNNVIFGNYGYTNRPGFGGGEDRGHALRVDSLATIVCRNVTHNTLFPVVGKGELEGDEIPNYATGGSGADTARSPYAFNTNAVHLPYLTNSQGGQVHDLTQRGGIRYQVPPWFIGKYMYLVIQTRRIFSGAFAIGESDNSAFGGVTSTGWNKVPNAGGTARYWTMSLASVQSDNYTIPAPAYTDQPRVDWIPVLITRNKGVFNLYIPGSVRIGYVCLVEARHLGRLGRWREVNTTYLGTAAPTVGTWPAGEIVQHPAPGASTVASFISVTAGKPGTWKNLTTVSP